jgi:hypothetical protein
MRHSKPGRVPTHEYLDTWRFAAADLELAWVDWLSATASRFPMAHDAYVAALDREEAAARAYATALRMDGAWLRASHAPALSPSAR